MKVNSNERLSLVSNESKTMLISFDEREYTTEEGITMYEYYSVRCPKNATYNHVVSAIITDKYDADEMDAIVNNYLRDNSSEDDETIFHEMQSWRSKAKKIAREVFGNEPTLEDVKEEKLDALFFFDKSSSVNEFTLQGNKMWLKLSKREDVRQSLIALKYKGVESFTYWNDTTPITLPIDVFEYILNDVEVYALECFNVTAQHKANIQALATIEEVNAYDFTVGYPSKLVF